MFQSSQDRPQQNTANILLTQIQFIFGGPLGSIQDRYFVTFFQ